MSTTPHPVAHDALVCVDAPGMAISGRDAQLRGHGVQGLYHDGRRTLSRNVLTIGGMEPEPLSGHVVAAGSVRYLAMRRFAADSTPDPALVVERTRHADGRERIVVRNTGRRPLRFPVELALGADLIPLDALRAGHRPTELPARVAAAGLGWSAPDGMSVRATAEPAPDTALAATATLRWDIGLDPARSWAVELRVVAEPGPGRPGPRAVSGQPPWAEPRVRCDDVRVAAWVAQGLRDLRALLVVPDPDLPTAPLPVVGAPWQLVPTGRDALWTARMLLPLGTRFAGGVLRLLAARQGTRSDPRGGEEEGRIPHTLGRVGDRVRYDCAGSTALFVTLLGEAWRWGLPAAETTALLPALGRALGHLSRTLGDRPGDFVRLGPEGPAPCELQAQTYEAALHGAALLDAHDLPGGGALRERAERLGVDFRKAFRAEDAAGEYYAAALDPTGRPITVASSAMAHLPGSGILDDTGSRAVARRLTAPDLDCGWGLRGTSARTPGYHPLAARGGVVRTHDTCVAAAGLAGTGHLDAAQRLFAGLLNAAPWFQYRMPEMHAGEQRAEGHAPVAHPLACRPLARAAGAILPVLVAFAGIRPDVPDGRVTVRPTGPLDVGELELRDLRIGGEPFTVRVNRAGQAIVEEAAAELQLAI
ncbi:glycogen debranching N-terminal domain-containing protein [Embleya sp. NBC_00896]|uniref:amylo-alpha-1,6-glucosidase n=1 Tax=Embleya sp. NBC_00896 TaxID=2975961 RepID=UPI00386BA8F3|nr:glycogen debranching protein [Embleya sp. NBC_00896]